MAEVVRTAPAEFIESAAKVYLDDLTKGVGQFKATDLSTVMGPDFIADPSSLTTDAEALAVAEDTGLGSFRPFLERAGELRGPEAYEDYMSPYQRDVIDATLKSFDVQAQRGLPALSARAIQAGAFGGGREGVERAVYKTQSDLNRALLESQLLQTGFGQAQNLAQQDFSRNIQLAQQSPALVGQQIAGLTTLGSAQTARDQQLETARQQLAQRTAFQDLEGAQQLGAGVTQLIAGYPGRDVIQPAAATPSSLATGLGTASTLAGIYRLINPAQQQIKIL